MHTRVPSRTHARTHYLFPLVPFAPPHTPYHHGPLFCMYCNVYIGVLRAHYRVARYTLYTTHVWTPVLTLKHDFAHASEALTLPLLFLLQRCPAFLPTHLQPFLLLPLNVHVAESTHFGFPPAVAGVSVVEFAFLYAAIAFLHPRTFLFAERLVHHSYSDKSAAHALHSARLALQHFFG